MTAYILYNNKYYRIKTKRVRKYNRFYEETSYIPEGTKYFMTMYTQEDRDKDCTAFREYTDDDILHMQKPQLIHNFKTFEV